MGTLAARPGGSTWRLDSTAWARPGRGLAATWTAADGLGAHSARSAPTTLAARAAPLPGEALLLRHAGRSGRSLRALTSAPRRGLRDDDSFHAGGRAGSSAPPSPEQSVGKRRPSARRRGRRGRPWPYSSHVPPTRASFASVGPILETLAHFSATPFSRARAAGPGGPGGPRPQVPNARATEHGSADSIRCPGFGRHMRMHMRSHGRDRNTTDAVVRHVKSVRWRHECAAQAFGNRFRNKVNQVSRPVPGMRSTGTAIGTPAAGWTLRGYRGQVLDIPSRDVGDIEDPSALSS